MTLSVAHAKINNIAAWTQADLNAQIVLGNFPTGTVLNDIVLSTDWNTNHSLVGVASGAQGGTGINNGSATLSFTGAASVAGSNSGDQPPGGSSGQLQYNNSSVFGGTAAGAYATSGNLFTFTAQAITDVPLALKLASGQTGDVFQIKDSTGTVTTKIDANNNIILNANNNSNTFIFGNYQGHPGIWTGLDPTTIGYNNYLFLNFNGAQSINGSGGLSIRANNTGQIYIKNFGMECGYNADGSQLDGSTSLLVYPGNFTYKALVLKAQPSQTADMVWITDSSNAVLTSFGPTGKINKYDTVATVGKGVPSIYGTGRSTAQTAAVTSLATYTVSASDGSFLVSGNVGVTTSVTHNFTMTVAYTDEGNTARTLTLSFSQLSGVFLTAITNVQGVGAYEGIPLHIRCKASTSITIATAGTFTSVTYNAEAYIIQIG